MKKNILGVDVHTAVYYARRNCEVVFNLETLRTNGIFTDELPALRARLNNARRVGFRRDINPDLGNGNSSCLRSLTNRVMQV